MRKNKDTNSCYWKYNTFCHLTWRNPDFDTNLISSLFQRFRSIQTSYIDCFTRVLDQSFWLNWLYYHSFSTPAPRNRHHDRRWLYITFSFGAPFTDIFLFLFIHFVACIMLIRYSQKHDLLVRKTLSRFRL